MCNRRLPMRECTTARWDIVLFPLLLAVVTATASPAAAATITVTSVADNTTVDGQVTLREAIIAANTDTSVDGSEPGSGTDQIVFATGPGTIVLNGTQLPTITGYLSIWGPGRSVLALDGARLSRILDLDWAVALDVSGLTFRNGSTEQSGGAIRSSGVLF